MRVAPLLWHSASQECHEYRVLSRLESYNTAADTPQGGSEHLPQGRQTASVNTEPGIKRSLRTGNDLKEWFAEVSFKNIKFNYT